ncbi:linear/branched/unsaturated fatty acid:CoA ligase LbuL [Streptomyces albiaxialis]|uniref:Linear/branched/unsaturated fatty acid:CoA ligase LbuL n=1 Tax=Streptomyces albiaxialis TaxID=329523 RepID=A0ABP5IE50_9ACTN
MPELSYASGTGAEPLTGDTIGARLRRTAARLPQSPALVDVAAGRRWTYEEFARDVDLLALGLLGKGVRRGERVGVWAPNCADWVLVQFAAARVGAVLVSINPAFSVGELRYVLQRSETELLFAARDREQQVEQVWEDCPALRDVFLVEPGENAGWSEPMDLGLQMTMTYPERLEERAAELSCDDPVSLQYTSGTTGSPKGATLSHHNILNNALAIGTLLGYDENDRICLPVPLFHTFGMVMGTLAAVATGACAVLPAPSFDAGAVLRAVRDEECTSLYGVPTMFISALGALDAGTADVRAGDLASLRTGIMAGATCPVEVMKRVMSEMGMAGVAICYGMTETSPVSLMTRADDDLERRTATVGTVMPHLEVKVVAPETGLTVPRGERGELCVRGYSVMLGYWEDPEQTAASIDAARWMHTGDLAEMGDDGYVRIVGRTKDMIIRGGENVSPREIEELLHTHPKISDVQVVGVPHERLGEEIAACVILAPGVEELSLEEIAAYCEGRLARYKIPRHLRVLDGFPLTTSGKVRKVELRATLAATLSTRHDVPQPGTQEER